MCDLLLCSVSFDEQNAFAVSANIVMIVFMFMFVSYVTDYVWGSVHTVYFAQSSTVINIFSLHSLHIDIEWANL